MTADEMLVSQVVPITPAQASRCGAPRLAKSQTSERSAKRMAGNGMSVPCVGVFVLFAMMAAEKV